MFYKVNLWLNFQYTIQGSRFEDKYMFYKYFKTGMLVAYGGHRGQLPNWCS